MERKIGIWIILIASITACSPTIYYLGDSFPATKEIEVFYDEKDVEKEYRTIGKMTHGNFFDYELETIKNKMIKKAKANGGDGILFLEVTNVRGDDDLDDLFDNDRLSITANVIKYKTN